MNNSKRIIRVFPTRTAATPTDDLAVVGRAPGLFDEADEVHVSVSFSWTLPLAEKLAKAWECVAPVQIGGPATGMAGGEFTPGMYVKEGYLITSRGCNNACWHCDVWRREGKRRELSVIHEGVNVLDDNWITCTDAHKVKTIEKIKAGKKKYGQPAQFTGGLEAAKLTERDLQLLRQVSPKQMFFAYDTPDDLRPLQIAGEMLLDYGWTITSHALRAYVLVGWPEDPKRNIKADTFAAAEQRIMETIEAGFMPCAMVYRSKGRGEKPPGWAQWQRLRVSATIIGDTYKQYHANKKAIAC